MCICGCVYIYECMHMFTYAHCVSVLRCAHVHVNVCMYLCMYICVNVFVRVHERLTICVCVYLFKCGYVCMHVCVNMFYVFIGLLCAHDSYGKFHRLMRHDSRNCIHAMLLGNRGLHIQWE